jgi:hypothetical protein
VGSPGIVGLGVVKCGQSILLWVLGVIEIVLRLVVVVVSAKIVSVFWVVCRIWGCRDCLVCWREICRVVY